MPDIQSYSSFFIGRQSIYSEQWKTLERCWVYSKMATSFAVNVKILSWFWIYQKQATGVLVLVDTVKFKVDIIS